MKQNKKAIAIIIIGMIFYSILVAMFAASRANKNVKKDDTPTEQQKPSDSDSKNDFDLIINPNTIISHNEKDGWYDNSGFDYKNIKFNVYIDGKGYDYRSIVRGDKWQMVNDDETSTTYEKSFIAIYSQIDYKVVNYEGKELSDSNKKDITDYLTSKNVNYLYDKLNIEYIYYDFNQDGVKDDVYIVSNVGIDDYTGFNKTFAFGFAKVLNQSVTFYEEIANNVNATNMCKPSFSAIIKIEDQNDLIAECNYISNSKSKHMMYNFVDKTVNKLVETKAN